MVSSIMRRHVLEANASVPDLLRVNHNRRPQLALIQATGLVSPDQRPQLPSRQLRLETVAQCSAALRIATASAVSRRALVATDEDMMCKQRHRTALAAPSSLSSATLKTYVKRNGCSQRRPGVRNDKRHKRRLAHISVFRNLRRFDGWIAVARLNAAAAAAFKQDLGQFSDDGSLAAGRGGNGDVNVRQAGDLAAVDADEMRMLGGMLAPWRRVSNRQR